MQLRPSTIMAWAPLLCLAVAMILAEFVPDHVHPDLRWLSFGFLAIYICLLAATLVQGLRLRLSLLGLGGFVVSAGIPVYIVWSLWASRNDCFP